MKVPNIYFVGKAGAGKSYACQHVIEKYGYALYKFAGPVYNIAKEQFGMVKKDRKLLQIVGKTGRAIDPNTWLNLFHKSIKNEVAPICCDDCRFINEHEFLKQIGFVGVYLKVSPEIRITRLTKRDGTAQK